MKTLRPPLLNHTYFRPKPSPFLIPFKNKVVHAKYPQKMNTSRSHSVHVNSSNLPNQTVQPTNREVKINEESQKLLGKESSKFVILGAVTVGMAVFLMGFDDEKALAFGPEGPLVEEFWDNMRRYAIYALTVSTGVIYAVFQPILELLRNPISALLVVIIFGGGIFIVSQVLSAMVGVSEFNYDYSY